MTIYAGMKIFRMGENLVEITLDETSEWENKIYIATSKNMDMVLRRTHMDFEGNVSIREVGFSKVESQPGCLWGSLYIPNLVDVMGSRTRILFFLNDKDIVIVDDYEYAKSIIARIRTQRTHQADTKEKFLYNFLNEIINRDLLSLSVYEKNLLSIEEKMEHNRDSELQRDITAIRNELLTLRGYYDELRDLGKELEEDENGFFEKSQRKYFGGFSDRADRLMNKAGQLLEYANQIKDDYQTSISARQNVTMQFLTIISTIFMPLTLITSWYGMNFQNMPELEKGYPFVILLSLCVVIITLIVFKKKKLL